MKRLLRSLPIAGIAATFAWASLASASPSVAERTDVEQWRAQRLASLTSETGWLTLAGLFWLKDGDNTFGRDARNTIRLDNPALAATAGSFVLKDKHVRFVARDGSGVTHEGKPVTSIDLVPDTQEAPTLLNSGSLTFFLIERAGNLGIRVRDRASPDRKNFLGLDYFPIGDEWVFDARFEPHQPLQQIKIVNILGMEENMASPGALVFTKNGRQWRLDAVLEEPDAKELFVMFTDGTSGRETYGGGRFLYVPLPTAGKVRVDFNKAYNPPCAFNDFATCPLPPFQNRLALRVEAGEKKYAGGH